MNTSIPSVPARLAHGHRPGRATTRRWPVLAVATVLAALPLGVAFADSPQRQAGVIVHQFKNDEQGGMTIRDFKDDQQLESSSRVTPR